MTATAPDLRSTSWASLRGGAVRRVARRRVWRWVWNGLSVVVFVVIAAPVVATLLPRFTGGVAVRVHSASMGDTHPVGSVVLTEPVPRSAIEAGDVVVIKKRDAAPTLHRVVELGHVRGRLVAKTKGDANPNPDPERFVLPKRVLVARHTLPYLGYVLAAVTTPIGWVLFLVVPAAAITASWLVQIWSPPSSRAPIRWRGHHAVAA